MAMAKADFRQCMACGIPFVILSHVDPIYEGEGVRFLHELFDFARTEAAAGGCSLEFVTLKQLAGVFNHEKA